MPPAVAPIAAGLGGALLSRSSGGSSSANPAADLQAQIAQQLFDQTNPLREALIGRSENFLTNGVGNSETFNAFRAGLDPQYAQARESIIGSTPAGGGLTQALTNLETDRARTLTQARGQIEESELSRALLLGTGSTGTAVSGLGQAASLQAAMAQAEADREAGILGALGAGAGAYFGSK